MRFVAVKGNFGNLNGQTINFEDGFSLHTLENGSGKSTICALIRVMLYGLNTSKRNNGKVLADKNRYLPANGAPMEGYLSLIWNNRPLLISRTTERGGLMQDFDAVYTDTGEKCRLLSAKNCGQVLLGMGEDAFLSSTFVDGSDMARSSEELQELVSGMAQSGDTQGFYFESMRRLGRWKLNFDSGNGYGERPIAHGELQAAQVQFRDQQALQTQLIQQREVVAQLQLACEDAEQAYEQAYQAFANEMAMSGRTSSGLARDYERRIAKMEQLTLDAKSLGMLDDALTGYHAAVRLAKEKQQVLAPIQEEYERKMRALEQRNQAQPPPEKKRVNPVAFVMALFFAVLSAGTWSYYALWWACGALFCCTVASLVWGFSGLIRKTPVREFDFHSAQLQLKNTMQGYTEEHEMAEEVLKDAKALLIERVSIMDGTLDRKPISLEQALDRVATYQQNAHILADMKRERASMVLAQQQGATQEEKTQSEQTADAIRHDWHQKQEALRIAENQLASMIAQVHPSANLAQLEAQVQELQARCAHIDQHLDAVQLAASVLQVEHQALSEVMSPQIIEVASAFLSYLTDEAYTSVRIDTNLRAIAVDAQGRPWQAAQLSAGTFDQVYLSVRLAVCTVLTGAKNVPIVLDDPFVTSDETRTERGMELLEHIAGDRQVIVFSCRE